MDNEAALVQIGQYVAGHDTEGPTPHFPSSANRLLPTRWATLVGLTGPSSAFLLFFPRRRS